MIREIKFRTWNPDDLEIQYPLVVAMCMSGRMKPLIKCADGNRAYKDYPLMQYAGIKDKNGVEIYEGDILQNDYLNLIFEVVWHQNGWAMKCVKHNEHAHIYGKYVKVIGNIYENPELLRV